jgi:cyclophilin family peptidyl-prolyl cis-trans isomerase
MNDELRASLLSKLVKAVLGALHKDEKMMNRVNRRRGQQSVDPTKATRAARRNSKLMLGGVIIASMLLVFLAFSFSKPTTIAHASKETRIHAKDIQQEVSFVECTINGGDVISSNNNLVQITVRHDLSPIASRVFVDLVQDRHFDDVFIFRVLKGFVAQWGIQTPDSKKVSTTDEIKKKKPDKTKDAVHANTLSNLRGTLSFAGGNPATCQVFVNLGNNQRLDREGSRPFATVSHSSMTQVLDALYTGYPDGQGQVKTLQLGGRDKMHEAFPRMSRVETCRVVSQFSTATT